MDEQISRRILHLVNRGHARRKIRHEAHHCADATKLVGWLSQSTSAAQNLIVIVVVIVVVVLRTVQSS